MDNKKFSGDKKLVLKSPLAWGERKIIEFLTPKFPGWIEGYHLTLMTIAWSAGVLGSAYLARGNYVWLWVSSAMVVLQWFTDCFDGALGRYRDTGIPKWGFYMDHFLDYVFMSSLFISYSFLLEGTAKYLVCFSVPVFGCLMVSSFLAFGVTGEFKITYLGTGPTEVRLYFIALNWAIIQFGIGWFESALPYIFGVFLAGLCIVVLRSQKYIWAIDMADINARK